MLPFARSTTAGIDMDKAPAGYIYGFQLSDYTRNKRRID
jgi:hypothetical protein